MSRQVKVMLAVVVILVLLIPVLAACPPPRPIEPVIEPVEEVPKIKIGVIGPMEFIHGEHKWAGAEMAAEEINAAGGVNVGGVMREIELVRADSNEILCVIDAAIAMDRLITVDEVDFVVGGFRPEAVLAMQEVMADHRVIFLGTGADHPELNMRVAADYERYRYWFRVTPVNSAYVGRANFALVTMVADVIRKELGILMPKVALMVEEGVWADPVIAAAEEELPLLLMEVIGAWRPSGEATDVTAELTAIKAAGAHMILTVLSGPVGLVYARQWGELEIPAASVGINLEAHEMGFWEATGGKGEYEMTLNLIGRVEITEETIPFFDRFVERFGEYPIYTAAGTYDALFILKEAIHRAGTVDSDAVVIELAKTDFVGVGGRVVFTGMDSPHPHDVIWGPGYVTGLGTQWRDGGLVVVWPDGRAVLGDRVWEGVRYAGTVDYELPPWMVEYWKGG
ncbi:ABC transporter substrate-binding protein [Dehalococcoidia bacterium]|nr:ABC transporter substrate-binding protein [Dehalococcoidia bacterium]